MLIAHAPAGFITAKLLFPRFRRHSLPLIPFCVAGVLGGIAPDFDLLYYYLIDHRAHHHHGYFTHYPLFWGVLLVAAAIWAWRAESKRIAALAFIFTLNGFGHLLLDSVVGGIRWLAPFSAKSYALARVHGPLHPVWLNFVLHWSFLLELAIVAWALWLLPGRAAVFGWMEKRLAGAAAQSAARVPEGD
jgi:inner membrane protein